MARVFRPAVFAGVILFVVGPAAAQVGGGFGQPGGGGRASDRAGDPLDRAGDRGGPVFAAIRPGQDGGRRGGGPGPGQDSAQLGTTAAAADPGADPAEASDGCMMAPCMYPYRWIPAAPVEDRAPALVGVGNDALWESAAMVPGPVATGRREGFTRRR